MSETKTKTPEYPIIFEGRKFTGIKEFDCQIVSLFTEPTFEGTFFTELPISPKDFRKRHPTRARVEIGKATNWVFFEIWDDHGTLSIMKIHANLTKEIDFATKAAFKQGLL